MVLMVEVVEAMIIIMAIRKVMVLSQMDLEDISITVLQKCLTTDTDQMVTLLSTA